MTRVLSLSLLNFLNYLRFLLLGRIPVAVSLLLNIIQLVEARNRKVFNNCPLPILWRMLCPCHMYGVNIGLLRFQSHKLYNSGNFLLFVKLRMKELLHFNV
ncbi:hypothetical protein L1887_30799 [Cichorium endivia]|nr:hypothetical protein L1887_30799 [Cichorium endivia]